MRKGMEGAASGGRASRLYKALVLPKLDYCSCVWDPASSTTLTDRLESAQRFAAKLCTKRWSDSPSLLTASLNWPSLCRRIIRKESIIPPCLYFSPRLWNSLPEDVVPTLNTTFLQARSFIPHHVVFYLCIISL